LKYSLQKDRRLIQIVYQIQPIYIPGPDQVPADLVNQTIYSSIYIDDNKLQDKGSRSDIEKTGIIQVLSVPLPNADKPSGKDDKSSDQAEVDSNNKVFYRAYIGIEAIYVYLLVPGKIADTKIELALSIAQIFRDIAVALPRDQQLLLYYTVSYFGTGQHELLHSFAYSNRDSSDTEYIVAIYTAAIRKEVTKSYIDKAFVSILLVLIPILSLSIARYRKEDQILSSGRAIPS
jgi:hypothetical protein